MKGVFRRSFNLGISVLRFYTLGTLLLMTGALSSYQIIDHGLGLWLGWAFSTALAAAVAGSLGAELRLLSGARLYQILPDARTQLVLSCVLIIGLALLPVMVMSLFHSALLGYMGAVIALCLVSACAGLWLGINGPMWLALIVMFFGLLIGSTQPELNTGPEMAVVLLAASSGLMLWSWRRFFGPGRGGEHSGSLRAWLWHYPQQVIGSRTLVMQAFMAAIFFGIISLPYLDPIVSLPDEPSFLTHLYSGVALVTTVIVCLAALNEPLMYRQRMRRLLMLPGYDRSRLHGLAEAGLTKLWLLLGLLPTTVMLAVALIAGQMTSALMLMAMMTLGTQLFMIWAALTMAAGRDGGIALVGLFGIMVGSFVLMAMLNRVAEADSWPSWAWLWIGATLVGAAWMRQRARRAWQNLSLESIDHWLLVRMAHQQWRSDV